MKLNLIWNRLLPSWERVVLCGLLLSLAPTVAAQEPPNFARVQALEKAVFPSANLDADGGVLFTTYTYATNVQRLGTNTVGVPNATNDFNRSVVAKLDRHGNADWTRTIRATNALYPSQTAIRDDSSNVLWLVSLFVESAFTAQLELDGTNVLAVSGPTGGVIPIILKLGPSGEFIWAKNFGADSFVMTDYDARPISAGVAGEFLLLGRHPGGTNSIPTPVLRKFDGDGNLLWQIQASGSLLSVTAAAADAEGNVFFAGQFGTNSFLEATNLRCSPVPGYGFEHLAQSFLARADGAGNLQWVIQSGTNGRLAALALTLDSKTNVLPTGSANATNVFGLPGVPENPYWSETSFLLKASPHGVPEWLRSMQGLVEPDRGVWGGGGVGTCVCVDASDSVYYGGQALGHGITFDGVPLYIAGSVDAFMAKYSAAGQIQWATKAGNSNFHNALFEATRSLVASADGLLAVGQFQASNAFFGPLTVTTGAVVNAGSFTQVDVCTFLALIPHPAPPLATELAGSELKVSWPTFPPEFALETATALGTPTLWSSNSVPVSTSNGTHSVTFPVDGPARYFRLSKPIP